MNIRKMSLIFVRGIFFVIIPCSVAAQRGNPFIDTLSASLKSKPRPEFSLDTRNSFITHLYARIRGVKVGLNYDDVLHLGLSYNWLSSPIITPAGITYDKGISHLAYSVLDFRYVAPYAEYTFYRKRNLELSIPVMIGAGYSQERIPFGSAAGTSQPSFALLYEPQMTAEYTFLKYFVVGAGTGYRLVLAGRGRVQRNLTSPIYILRASVHFARIYRDLRH